MKKYVPKILVLLGIAGFTKKAVAIGLWICGLIILVVGGIVVIKLKHFCDAHLRDPGTNSPPSIPAQGTNSSGTNQLASSAKIYTVDWKNTPVLSLDDDNFEYYDTTGYFTNNDLQGLPFTTRLAFKLCTSTDLMTWTEYSVTGWASSQNILLLFSTNGVPMLTNYQSLHSMNLTGPIPQLQSYKPDRQFIKIEKP